ncbi:transcriptional regulator [Campylobacter sp. LR291e]|uniref:transcriptional regulator n=2 Tax=Campylobacter TaxID=194 RepID=UPI001238B7D2|nr:transcriptional regulator [Campylobacter sp. LR291e]KAA6229645.1 transcriptional regulator [Campylobacter sp. LR291e]
MRYVLKNKDIDILEFEIKKEKIDKFRIEYHIVNFLVLKKDLLPIPLNYEVQLTKDNISKWIEKRKIPSNRAFANKILKAHKDYNPNNFMSYIDISFGLSLNDTYWITPFDKNYKWKDYNLYENNFSEILELVAFIGKNESISGLTISPEFTTNGMLKKCWHRLNEKIYLYKGNFQGKEVFSEYYSYQVAKILGFDAVFYDLKEFHKELVSACPIFTNEKEGYVPIYYFLPKEERKEKFSFKKEKYIEDIFGKENFENLMLFDAIIGNTDRHLGNFGMIIDNDTNEILRPAPIFDNGLVLLNLMQTQDLKNILSIAQNYITSMNYTFKQQLSIYVRPRHENSLKQLLNFKIKKHELFNLSDEWLNAFETFIKEQAKLALNILKEKSKDLKTKKLSFKGRSC